MKTDHSPLHYGDLGRYAAAQLAIDRHLIAALRGAVAPGHPEFAVVGNHLESALALIGEWEGTLRAPGSPETSQEDAT